MPLCDVPIHTPVDRRDDHDEESEQAGRCAGVAPERRDAAGLRTGKIDAVGEKVDKAGPEHGGPVVNACDRQRRHGCTARKRDRGAPP